MLLYCILTNTQGPGLSCDWKVTVNNVYNKAWEGKSVQRATSEVDHACETGPY